MLVMLCVNSYLRAEAQRIERHLPGIAAYAAVSTAAAGIAFKQFGTVGRLCVFGLTNLSLYHYRDKMPLLAQTVFSPQMLALSMAAIIIPRLGALFAAPAGVILSLSSEKQGENNLLLVNLNPTTHQTIDKLKPVSEQEAEADAHPAHIVENLGKVIEILQQDELREDIENAKKLIQARQELNQQLQETERKINACFDIVHQLNQEDVQINQRIERLREAKAQRPDIGVNR
jgi:hypothetical protein